MYWRQVLAQAVKKQRHPLAGQEIPFMSGATPAQSFSGYEPKKLFTRKDEGRFEECSFVEGFESRLDGRSLVSADLDGDGDLELLMLNRNAPRVQLFENVGPNGNAFELQLEAKQGHREADGAVVLVDGLGALPVLLNRGYASSVDPAVHVGLGTRTSAPVKVRWRSGVVESFGTVKAGGRYRAVEGSGEVTKVRAFTEGRASAPRQFPKRVEALALPAHEGATVVQLFMQSCKPCREEVPALNALNKQGVAVFGLGLHAEDELPKVKQALRMDYPVAPLPEAVAEAFETPAGLALPTVLIYGKDGALVRVLSGAAQLSLVLNEL